MACVFLSSTFPQCYAHAMCFVFCQINELYPGVEIMVEHYVQGKCDEPWLKTPGCNSLVWVVESMLEGDVCLEQSCLVSDEVIEIILSVVKVKPVDVLFRFSED